MTFFDLYYLKGISPNALFLLSYEWYNINSIVFSLLQFREAVKKHSQLNSANIIKPQLVYSKCVHFYSLLKFVFNTELQWMDNYMDYHLHKE